MLEAKTFRLVTNQNDSRLPARQMAVVQGLRQSLVPNYLVFFRILVEPTGIEPVTSAVRLLRSPN